MNYSGNEGCVLFLKAGGTPPAKVIEVGQWNYEERVRLGEATHCGSGGYAVWVGGPKEASGQFVLPWDDEALVTTAGYTAGSKGDATFKLGSSTLALKGPIIIESTNFELDAVNGDPIRVTVGYRGTGPFVLEGSATTTFASPAPSEGPPPGSGMHHQ